MSTENIYLHNLKKIFLLSPAVGILLFLCCHLLLRFVCVWQNGSLRQGIGRRHVFLLNFCKLHLVFFCKLIRIMQNCESTAAATSELEILGKNEHEEEHQRALKSI